MAVTTATLLTVAAVATVAAAGYSAYTTNQQSKAQAALMNMNARNAELEAADQRRDAQIRAQQQREQNRRFLARSKAIQAKQGILSSTGSPLAVLADQAAQLEMNALEIERGGTIASTRLRQQADYSRMEAGITRRGGKYAATGTLLSGAANAASIYGSARYAGA